MAARTLATLQRLYGWTDEELGRRAGGYTRQQIEPRRNGKTRINTDDLDNFARAFGVPVYVMLMDPADAVRYVIDQGEPPDDGDPPDEGGSPPDPPRGGGPGGSASQLDVIRESGAHNPRYAPRVPVAA